MSESETRSGTRETEMCAIIGRTSVCWCVCLCVSVCIISVCVYG